MNTTLFIFFNRVEETNSTRTLHLQALLEQNQTWNDNKLQSKYQHKMYQQKRRTSLKNFAYVLWFELGWCYGVMKDSWWFVVAGGGSRVWLSHRVFRRREVFVVEPWSCGCRFIIVGLLVVGGGETRWFEGCGVVRVSRSLWAFVYVCWGVKSMNYGVSFVAKRVVDVEGFVCCMLHEEVIEGKWVCNGWKKWRKKNQRSPHLR